MHIGQIDIVKLLEQLLEEAYPNFEEKICPMTFRAMCLQRS